MRLKIFNTPDIESNGLSHKTKEMLATEIEKDSSVIMTDENPEVIHIIGAWDTTSVKIANDAIKKHIALVFTPLGSLSPWYKPSSSFVKLSSKATAMVSSGVMEHELLSGQEKKNLHLILNAVTTATTTAEEMASAYKIVYKEAIEETDAALWKEIDRKIGMLNEKDEAILLICRHLLYAQYMYKRQNIPHKFINNLAVLMTNSNYNEDDMIEMLKLINLNVFTQHLEYVMMEKSALTEGFMPIIYKKDKVSEKMIELVTDY
jgi:hypothetical protein